MASCTTIAVANYNTAKDKIASYIIYYTTGNTFGACGCKSRCNSLAERNKLRVLIETTTNANGGLKSQLANIACNIQLHGSASQIEGQCRDMARAILQINNTPATAKCPDGTGGGGGVGLGGLNDLLKPPTVYYLIGGVLALILILKK